MDTEPPRVVSSAPDSGQVETGSVSEVCITFSEAMDKRSVGDMLLLRPAAEVRDTRWRKNTFCLSLADPLDSTATYVVTLLTGCRDAHGNHMKAPYAFTFTGADTIEPGTIKGSVEVKGLPAPGIPVWAFDSLTVPEPDFTKDDPAYVSQTGPDGKFSLMGIPGGVFLMYAFKDKDANRVYDEGTDFTSPAAEAVLIGPGHRQVTGVKIDLVDPTEPSEIWGVVHHCLPETVAIVVTAQSLADSSKSFSITAGRDSVFAFTDIPADRYSVCCYADFDKSNTREAETEPACEDAHTVRVAAGAAVKDVKLEIACRRLGTPEESATEETAKDETEDSNPSQN